MKNREVFALQKYTGDPKSLSSNVVRTIYEGHRDVLWIGTGFPFVPDEDGGLNRMNPDGTFIRYLHDPNDLHSLINNKVRSIFEDNRGVFWVGTSGQSLQVRNLNLVRRRPALDLAASGTD